jgi:hypothetical protein
LKLEEFMLSLGLGFKVVNHKGMAIKGVGIEALALTFTNSSSSIGVPNIFVLCC